MRPIDPAEISALIDGELPPERVQEVRRAIAEDASLRRVYDELAAMDAKLTASAARAMFQPEVVLPGAVTGDSSRVFLTAILLVVLRLAMKLASPELATGMAIVMLAVVVGWVLQRLAQASEEECRHWVVSDL
jgi:anti-sigma factor RsiW